MSKSPPRKKLKQTSILEIFKPKRNNATKVKEDHKGKEKCSGGRPEPEGQEDNMDPEMRKKMVTAADKRRLHNSPDVTPVEPNKPVLPTLKEDKQSNKSTENSNALIDLTAEPSTSKEFVSKPSTSQAGGLSPNGKEVPKLTKSDTMSSGTLEYDNSPDLFTDDETDQALVEQEMLAESISLGAKQDSHPWRGTPKDQLNRTPRCAHTLPSLKPCPTHRIMFKPHIRESDPPRPYPEEYRDTWDANHVKMPCSEENLYPVEGKNGKKELKNRWKLIKESLSSRMTNCLELEEAILSYNTRFVQKWDFRGLHAFFMDVLEREETIAFFKETLPKIIHLALRLPDICTQSLPLLKRQKPCSVSLTQLQISCLLANAFFCTFPRRNSRQKQSEYSTFPEINFNQLFMGSKEGISSRKAEKLKCIMNYFRRVTSKVPTGVVTFTRQRVQYMPQWDQSSSSLPNIHVTATDTIEEGGAGMLQVDFANKFLGGGVLGFGCVQEEIRFLICPEMIISRLITEVLDPNECLIMTGCEQFSTYTGYGDTFRWSGNHVDKTPRDSWGRRYTEVVAIDAIHLFRRPKTDQFKPGLVKRELNKAYCGFKTPDVPSKNLPAVATGNWGCGAFGGDLRLKALIQMMAAGEAHRDICYFTFGDYGLKEEISKIHQFLKEKDLRMSDLWSLIQQFYKNECQNVKKPKKNLFQFIYKVYSDSDNDTDDDTQPNIDGPSDSQEVVSNWEAEFDGKIGQKEPDWQEMTP